VGNPDDIGSVTMDIGERILQGETPELFYSNGYIVFKIKDKDDLILLLDLKTGVVRDVSMTICGAYCFHNQITDRQIQLAENLTSSDPNVQPKWMGFVGITVMSAAGEAGAGVITTVVEGGVTLVRANPLVAGAALLFCAVFFGGNYLCDQYGWLPPEQCRQIVESGIRSMIFLHLGPLALFLPEDRTPKLEELEDAYWKSAYLLMAIAESDDTELLNDLFSKRNWKEIKKILSGEKAREIQKRAEELSEDPDFGITIPPDDRVTRFLGFFVNKIREGYGKLKAGDYVGGTKDIAIGTSGINLVVGSWALYEYWPDWLWPKSTK